MELLSLNDIAGGALQEKVNEAMNRVLENMQDPNTPWKVKRNISIKIGFTQNEERDDTAVELSIDTKLAPVSPIVTRMSIGTDLRTGQVYAEEYGKQVRGQMSLDLEQPDTVQTIGDKVVDTETEEIIGEKGNKEVINFRKAAM